MAHELSDIQWYSDRGVARPTLSVHPGYCLAEALRLLYPGGTSVLIHSLFCCFSFILFSLFFFNRLDRFHGTPELTDYATDHPGRCTSCILEKQRVKYITHPPTKCDSLWGSFIYYTDVHYILEILNRLHKIQIVFYNFLKEVVVGPQGFFKWHIKVNTAILGVNIKVGGAPFRGREGQGKRWIYR